MKEIKSNIKLEDAKLLFTNFSGKQTQYNRAGDRNFNVLIDDSELAGKLANDGWNIKVLQGKEEGDPDQFILPVAVKFNDYGPIIHMLTSGGDTILNEETVSQLDVAAIVSVDLIIRPYNYSIPTGKSGVKAYLQKMYVTIYEDDLDKKHANKRGTIDSNEEFY